MKSNGTPFIMKKILTSSRGIEPGPLNQLASAEPTELRGVIKMYLIT